MAKNSRSKFPFTWSEAGNFFREGSVVVVVILLALVFVNQGYCRPSTPAVNSLGRSPVIDPGAIEPGYTLLALRDGAYLIDLFGKPAHVWPMEDGPYHALLRKNGNLVAVFLDQNVDKDLPEWGGTGIIREFDWAGNIVWEYRNELLHHDFDVLPNGNIAAIIWQQVPEELAQNIKGGVAGTERKGKVLSDVIIEVDRQGTIVWRWQAYEHLDPQKNKLGPLSPRSEWTHTNSVQYIRFDRLKFFATGQIDPSGNDEGYLISLGRLNKVMIVAKQDGQILWESKPGLMSYQHDATLLPNGNILVFDNGEFRRPSPGHIWGSRVIEIEPQSGKVVWQFKAGATPSANARFSAPIASGSQRLSNGNTLVVDGPRGHLFEVIPEGRAVWDFIVPFVVERGSTWPEGTLFKARRYLPGEIAWPELLSGPLPALSSVCWTMKDMFTGR